MKVYINNELKENITTIQALQRIIEDIRLDCQKTKHIMEIKIDDKSVDKLPIGLMKDEINKIEVKVSSPVELIIGNMVDSFDYLPDLRLKLGQAATCFQQGNFSEGIDLFRNSIDGLIWLNHLLTSFRLYFLSDQGFKLERSKYQVDMERFEKIIAELMESWENEDYVLISDLIEYELMVNLEDWQNNFIQILDKLASEADG